MKVSIIRVDKNLPLPGYETRGSLGFDLITREDTVIEPGKIALVPGNAIVKIPEGYALLLIPRSSLPRKKSLICPHSIGLIDQDYCGPKDELMVQVQNISDEKVTVERGEKIAQGLFVKVEKADWTEVSGHNEETRGGFGSTDTTPSLDKLGTTAAIS
ncbi:dUTP diphosphatase [Candidatus Peribacteria bacterium]|jgi:dUTP pyrophosphatase|nr:dUTP diphosphatase [Candidatus Peribacteria bacterium]MBT4020807.1 dUTP diphosphatase [Candidatus Peribacteria bacterium]MBT4241017.1 dUTP diphosphatase [Candidatus Peribacteria bacterium]MBT4474485.1 dUTP diphosphatase [Candidatus Peribacteria bacterium]